MKLINTLNIEQKAAATSESNHTLVVASAGTGKTKTIMARIEHMLDIGIPASEILVITFTNKASVEIKERLLDSFEEKTVNSLTFGTFHAIAYRHVLMGYPDAKVINKFHAMSLLGDAASILGYKHEEGNYSLHQLHYFISKFSSSRMDDFEDYIFEQINDNEKNNHPISMYKNIYYKYLETKIKYHSFEFDDLLRYVIMYPEELGIKRYKYLIVDEYQDTNPLQEKFLDTIGPNSFFCVGDYDQSIYGFNGSDITIISNFIKKYKNSYYFNLSKNYRSAPKILELAEKVISRNKRIFPKKIIAQYAGKTGNERPQYLKFDSPANQFVSIASFISSIPLEKRNDVAILYRGNSSADKAEIFLNSYGIEYERKSGSSFFQQDDIQIMIAAIKIIGGRFSKEDLIMAYHYRNVRSETIGVFHDNIIRCGEKTFSYPELANNTEQYSDAIYLSIQSYADIKKKCSKLKKTSLIVKYILESDWFKQLIKGNLHSKKKIPFDIAKSKLQNKQDVLINISNTYASINSFLNNLSKKSKKTSQVQCVNLMSVHSSKGLEFDVVFIVDLTEKQFPNKRLIEQGGTIEEERRLFYVAVTRAKNVLWLCYPEKTEAGKKLKPSVFLVEAGFETNYE